MDHIKDKKEEEKVVLSLLHTTKMSLEKLHGSTQDSLNSDISRCCIATKEKITNLT